MVVKAILILSGGKEAVNGIKTAKEMNLKVVVSDYNPKAPGFDYADAKIIASTYDPEETLRQVRNYNGKIDAVITIACDATRTVASVADYFGLPGPSLKTALLATEKLEMKKQFQKDKVPIPWFKEITSLNELERVIKEKGFPLVLKPVDNRGARGVLRLTEDVDLEWAYDYSLKNSFSNKVMIEEWLTGLQFSSESIVWDNEITTPLFAYRNYSRLKEFKPYIIEDGGHMPANLSEKEISAMNELIKLATKSIGLKRGIIKGDIVLTKDGPKIIEVAARLSGGYYSTFEIPLSTGVDIVKTAIEISLNKKPDFNELKPKRSIKLAQRYLFPEPGKVICVEGVERVRRIPWIELCEVYAKKGDIVEKASDHTKRGGVIIAKGKTIKEAVKRAEEAVKMIKIETEE